MKTPSAQSPQVIAAAPARTQTQSRHTLMAALRARLSGRNDVNFARRAITRQADVDAAVRAADIVTSTTRATGPFSEWESVQPGPQNDLIGAYRPDMREADDVALQRARVFVDSFDTTVGHIGEVKIPLESGAISRDHLVADYYSTNRFERRSDDEITLFKNGGGAHLDLMIAGAILQSEASQ